MFLCNIWIAVLRVDHWVGHCVWLNLCVCVCVWVQFQSGGDPKTGAVVSAQEAQAQAILQQTKVLKSSLYLLTT